MKVLKILALTSLLGLAACTKVPAGNVGVKFYLLGGDKGIDTEELSPGRYWIGINEELYLFPTFTQNVEWLKDHNEEISFQTVEGLSVSADIGVSYAVDPTKVSILFQKYRKGIDEITDVYLRNMVRDALVTEASTQAIESVYGAGKADLMIKVENRVRNQVSDFGLTIERIYWVGELRLPANIITSINEKIQANQKASQRRNEVEQSKAEAEKVRQTAQGEADAKLLIARADAEGIKIRGEALRDNPQLVQLNAVEKWNGQLPVYMFGNSVPFVTLPDKKE